MRFFKHCCVVFLVLFCMPLSILFAQDTTPDSTKTESENDQIIESSRNKRHKVYTKKLQSLDNQIDSGNVELSTILEAAQLALNMAQHEKASKYYRKAIRAMRDNDSIPVEEIRTVYKQLIYLYQREHKLEMAIVTFKQMCDNEPDNTEIRFEFAQFLQKAGFPRRALLEYQKILSQQPDNLLVIDKIMQLHAQGYLSKEELESIIPKHNTQ